MATGLYKLVFYRKIHSINMHEKNGFRMTGYHESIEKLKGIWQTINLLERRSK